MELKAAIEARTSVRVYSDEPVNMDDVKEMVRLAGLAPSVNNYQPWRYIAITNRDLLNRISDEVAAKIEDIPVTKSVAAANVKKQVTWFSTFFKDAPVLLVLVTRPYETVLESAVELTHEEINTMRNFPDIQSAGASIQNILLAAVDMGYGACWMSGAMFARVEIETILNIKAPEKALAFVVLGRPKSELKPKAKPNLAESMEIIN
ncbi:MAG TPA: nitroreductase family protein [Bacteroidales bacterium]|jgi:nitroreductase|nr:nitroreductase family protein [Bacteroidales bacterium]